MTALGVGATQPVRTGLIDQPRLKFLPLLLCLPVVLGALLGGASLFLVILAPRPLRGRRGAEASASARLMRLQKFLAVCSR